MPSELCFPTFQSADPLQLAATSFSNLNQDDDDDCNDYFYDGGNHIESDNDETGSLKFFFQPKSRR